MVAISSPIWSLGCCNDDRLGDFNGVAKFRDWCEDCGFNELLLLPLNSHLIDTRLHLLRRNLVISDNLQTVLEQFCTRYISNRQEILLERCPYYSCSAFAVSPLWYPLKCNDDDPDDHPNVVDRADALNKYFQIQYALSPSKSEGGSNQEESVLELWSMTWIKKLIHLVVQYKSQSFSHDIIVQHVISMLSDSQMDIQMNVPNDGHSAATGVATAATTTTGVNAQECVHTRVCKIAADQENAPNEATRNFCQWISLNAYWALSYGLWEALSDEYSTITLEEIVSKEGFQPRHTANWNDWQIGPYSVELLLHVLNQALDIERLANIQQLTKGSASRELNLTSDQSSEEQENVVGIQRRVGMGVLLLKNNQALKELFLFSLFTQWQIDEEWRRRFGSSSKRCGKRTKLVGDIPIYVPTSSADTWSYPRLFNMDARDGALRPKYVSGLPPDYWSKEGQLWGTPCYDWESHYGELVRFWEERIKRNLNFFDMIRLDHYRAFADYWGIPEAAARRDKSSRSGSWRPGPGSQFFYRMLTDLNICSTKFIVEDLGEATTLFNTLKEECPFANMSVLQFVLDEAIHEAMRETAREALHATALSEARPSTDKGDATTMPPSTSIPSSSRQAFVKLRIPTSALLFTSTHDNPALQKWLDDMDHARKVAVNRITGIPLQILNSCIGGRTLAIWLIENHEALRRKNERPCFNPAHQGGYNNGGLDNGSQGNDYQGSGKGGAAEQPCELPGSSLCIHLPDLISAPACINVPGQISGAELWSWNLNGLDWETMSTLVFKAWVRALISPWPSREVSL
ncbi:4-alpha-glucanotransferase [Gregarina niphandrodes]|uniref:4-alpha-glucanotransferase n=1 Tax=Gregarina niphandrodes TaxID=110365 RepID=A0A023B742_GRENI|nr:4-alpha-glucanotransferase [Gregarina niphandrodes]EZG67008.1 4-alpha-glucanotransferase [Gregarina niphandrodes]|eukprot:XP_011130395.1 4-alpha-glucanotransferase [Gregarina niphandrodes]